MARELELWFSVLFIVLLFAVAIASFSFSRFTMVRIERAMREDGFPVFVRSGITDMRLASYTLTILLPKTYVHRLDRFINTSLVKSYTTTADWIRALLLVTSFNAWIITIFVGLILGF